MNVDPPKAPQKRSKRKSNRHSQDPWQWLENIDNPKTLEYLNSENEYYERHMLPQAELQNQILNDLLKMTIEDEISIPEKDENYWYYFRFIKEMQYPIFCRKKGDLSSDEEVYLDQNDLAKGHSYCEVGFADVNSNHELLAYSVDFSGDERYTILLKNILTQTMLSDRIENASSCFEWKDATSFFYVELDEFNRPNAVKFHRLGDHIENDHTIYYEKDPAFFVSLDASESDEYIFIISHGYQASEVYAHRIVDSNLEFKLIEKRSNHHEYEVSHHKDQFYILTNKNAENFCLMSAPISASSSDNWVSVLKYEPEVITEGFVTFEQFFVILERIHCKPRLRVITPDCETNFIIEHDDEAYEISIVSSREFSVNTFRYWYSSPNTPQILYEYDVFEKTRQILKKRDIPDPNFLSSNYEIKRLWAPSRDNKSIPITLMFRKDLRLNGPQPLLLHGYGSYGEILDCEFSQYRLAAADHGFIYAMAHIRGGMDLGRHWYIDGKLNKKWNSFHDFIDASEYLINSGWTSPSHLVAEGSSAGGLLMGVIANERPDLYCGIVATVPFVDVVNTMLDPEQTLTTLEYFEWGHPDDPAALEMMRSYSPYDNVKKQGYPHLLVVAGLNDQRVMYWEACKWVAKLRRNKTNDNLLLLKVDMNSGHSGASGRYDFLNDLAAELCFIIMLKNEKMPTAPESTR